MTTSWKVGRLAESAGLTVRTLHHWDELGVLSPSRRTPSGHREYTEDDLVRLYRVLALRSLGLDLDTVRTCLDTGVDPIRLVRDHRAGVDEAITRLTALRERLDRVEAGLVAGEEPDTAALIAQLGTTLPVPHVGDADLRALADGVAALGPAAHYVLDVEWPELYRRAEALRRRDVPPDAPEVGRIVARLDELSALVGGGDRRLSRAVRDAWIEGPASGWRDVATYLDRARELRSAGGAS
ncbi:MerR family transcriptional regulator [Streptomyces sp. SID3343]|uniref:MerR family transcriptional regulator n=1 Tax=Streptomyces sp. SID3343 TaxID=2690260 RepID=UPI00136BBADB|nr:MerR family transcriptional regulator [Streptomyces sp. SID3343]MYW00894.1 MerR family transcriptional regulator [Streptomyces sp. SID3343]